MKARITKIEGKPTSHTPIGYWVEGALRHPIKIGQSVVIVDPRFSDKARWDWFETTPVVKFDGKFITTKNSKWELTTDN